METLDILDELRQKPETEYVSFLCYAWVHLGLGESEEALGWFERAFEESFSPYHLFLGDSAYDQIRGTERFRQLLAGTDRSAGRRFELRSHGRKSNQLQVS